MADGYAPPDRVDDLEWSRYNSFNLSADHLDMLEESKFARMSAPLRAYMAAKGLDKPQGDTLSALRRLNKAIHDDFDYEIGVTEVNSPIDDALAAGRGVCQDFAHIMIAAARSWGIPARYASGYLHHHRKGQDRSGEDASHAWVETWLPSLGWLGFDPTNDVLAGERHIRVALGRDYADVPPTRGTYKGGAQSELAIAVSVQTTQAPVRHDEFLRTARTIRQAPAPTARADQFQQQQQQQQ